MAVRKAGLSLHLNSGFSNTVTVLDVPKGASAEEILRIMRQEHHIMLAGSFDSLEGQVIRIGHMGTNANEADMEATMEALGQTLSSLGIPVKGSMGQFFRENL